MTDTIETILTEYTRAAALLLSPERSKTVFARNVQRADAARKRLLDEYRRLEDEVYELRWRWGSSIAAHQRLRASYDTALQTIERQAGQINELLDTVQSLRAREAYLMPDVRALARVGASGYEDAEGEPKE